MKPLAQGLQSVVLTLVDILIGWRSSCLKILFKCFIYQMFIMYSKFAMFLLKLLSIFIIIIKLPKNIIITPFTPKNFK